MKHSYKKWAVGACAVSAVLTGMVVASPIAAASTSAATCTARGDITLDPGAYPTPSSFTFHSFDSAPDAPGDIPLDCDGAVDDATVTGWGSYTMWGAIDGGTCTNGSGTGGYEAWIPTTDGVKHLTGTFDIAYAGLSGTESDPQGGMTGSFYLKPSVGSCVGSDPLTSFHIHQNSTFTTSSVNV